LSHREEPNYLPKDYIDFEDVAKAKEGDFDIEIFTPQEMVKLLLAAQVNPNGLPNGFNVGRNPHFPHVIDDGDLLKAQSANAPIAPFDEMDVAVSSNPGCCLVHAQMLTATRLTLQM
jgi:hypothetical protein